MGYQGSMPSSGPNGDDVSGTTQQGRSSGEIQDKQQEGERGDRELAQANEGGRKRYGVGPKSRSAEAARR